MRKALPAFAASLRGLVKGYVITVEAHRLGGCHAHVQVILNRQVGMYEDDEGRYRCADTGLRRKIKEKWAKVLGMPIAWAHSDI
jgi:hypothetical protein